VEYHSHPVGGYENFESLVQKSQQQTTTDDSDFSFDNEANQSSEPIVVVSNGAIDPRTAVVVTN
jgi:hypothetical protein